MKKPKAFNGYSTCPVTTWQRWSRSQARVPAHVYARLSLLQLVPSIAGGIQRRAHHRIPRQSASPSSRMRHRPPPTSSAGGRIGRTKSRTCYPRSTFPRGYKPTSTSPLPRHRSSKEDPTLNPPAGACVTMPPPQRVQRFPVRGRTGRPVPSRALLSHAKINAHIDREVAAHPELIQIENGYRAPKEQAPWSRPQRHLS